MIKMKSTSDGDGHAAAIRDLEAMPEVATVDLVSGEYDLVAETTVDIPTMVKVIANKIQAKKWVESVHVLKVEPAEPNPFLDEVCSVPGGECIRWCAQCGMCSASCPNVAEMDYSPRKTIALIRAGRRYDVLTSNTMWVCASCYLCTARCPRDVKLTELMHALERLSAHGGLHYGKATPTLYKIFIANIESNGRICEVLMMLKFYFSTIFTGKMNPLTAIKMLPVALKLLSHGRMPLKPEKIKGREQLKAMLERARALEGAS